MNKPIGLIGKILIAVFVISITIFSLLKLNENIEPKLIISNNQIEFSAPYGTTIGINEIKTVSLREGVPSMQKKIIGVDSMNSLSGSFTMSGFGDGKVFLGSRKKGPYIYIELKDGYILLNSQDEGKTKEMSKTLSDLVNK